MKKKFKDSIELNIFTNNSPEAKNVEIDGPTNVFVGGERVSLEVIFSEEAMATYIKKIIA